MNIIGIIVLNLMVNTYGSLIFDWKQMPVMKPDLVTIHHLVNTTTEVPLSIATTPTA
jgi:hypothetical protein